MMKQALINFAMIQTTILAISINLGTQVPTDNQLKAMVFIWFIIFAFTLIPTVSISLLFGFLQNRSSNG